MDLNKLEAMVQRMVARGGEGVREALKLDGLASEELEWAAATLAGREAFGPVVPTDPDRPWA